MFFVALFLVACAGGGGFGGCSGCAGITPIPRGYPDNQRIANAVQIRLTPDGLTAISNNAPAVVSSIAGGTGGGLSFPVPQTTQTVEIPLFGGLTIPVELTLCAEGEGQCGAALTIDSLQLVPVPATSTTKGALRANIRARIMSTNGTGGRATEADRSWEIAGTAINGCTIAIDTTPGSRPNVGLSAEVEISAVPNDKPARRGYSRVRLRNVGFLAGEDIEGSDVTFGDAPGENCLIAGIGNLLSGFIGPLLSNQIAGLADSGAIADNLCLKAGTGGCPPSTFADDSNGSGANAICRFGSASTDECVPMLLGLDGQGDLGAAFLGALSPGAHAHAQLLLAAGGDATANDGFSLSFYGGLRSTTPDFFESPGHNRCVPSLPAPTTLPTIAQAPFFLTGNSIPGTSPAEPFHIGIGITEKYLNASGYPVFDSGMLCLGVTTRLNQQLSTGILSLLAASLKDITFPYDNAAVGIVVRPQRPPTFAIGTTAMQPLLTVAIEKMNLDFYAWSNERYLRFMTLEADFTIGLNIDVVMGKLAPKILTLRADNAVVSNNAILKEDAPTLAMRFGSVLSVAASALAGAIDPIAFPAALGLQIEVPAGGVKGLEDGGEKFLGIFVRVAAARPASLELPPDTRLAIEELIADPDSYKLESFGKIPSRAILRVEGLDVIGESGTGEYEYSYRVNNGSWSTWASGSQIDARDPALAFEGRHTIEARARRVGSDRADETPAREQLLIDFTAPEVTAPIHSVRDNKDFVVVDAGDIITPKTLLQYRFRFDNGAFGAWTTDARAALPARDAKTRTMVEVEVRDEIGNVGRSSSMLIRGLGPPGAAAGCGGGCAVQSTRPAPFAPILVLLLGGLFVFRRAANRKHLLAAALTSALVLTPVALQGCDGCGGKSIVAQNDGGPRSDANGRALEQGMLATHLDMAITADSKIVFSGYSPGSPSGQARYGDLVFGRWNESSNAVDWEIVDGVPSTPPTGAPTGWRGGVADPGDDVGQYSSIAVNGDRTYIAYYDATNAALKVAMRTGTAAWRIHAVDLAGGTRRVDNGRYASITVLRDGRPAIAFMRVERDTSGTGVTSGVRVAIARSADPAASSEWDVSTVDSTATKCRAHFCTRGEACLVSGGCVTAATGCTPVCGATQACVAGACQETLLANNVDDLVEGMGLFASIAATSTGPALVYYDRTRGTLKGARRTGDTWSTFVIDGYDRTSSPLEAADAGAGAALAVDAADVWHVSYIDGASESLRYVTVRNGIPGDPAVVDDGYSDGTTTFTDGKHIVGDDSSIAVGADGTIRIVYQDATSHTLRAARRPPGASGFERRAVDIAQSTGYFARVAFRGAQPVAATFWRAEMAGANNGVRVFSL